MENLFVNIFLFSAFQGILLSIFLFTKKDNHTANFILGIAILALSLELLQTVYYFTGLYKTYPHLMGVTYAFPFLYGPIFYLYTKTISSGSNSFYKINLIHFIPFFLVFLYTIPVLLSGSQAKIEFLNKMIFGKPPTGYTIISTIMPFHGIIYTGLTVMVISNHNKKIKESFSNIDKINLEWLRIIMIAMIVIWSIVCISFMSKRFLVKHTFNFAVPLAISILIYSIGYLGLKQPEIFRKYKIDRSGAPDTEPLKESRYKKSGLKDEEADKILNSLVELMEKGKLYLESDLTIQKLSEVLSISHHNLSEVINTKLNQNFYDFVNRYRVEEVKQKIKNPEFSNLNFLGIAFESGFKSKTSFNNSFKKYTGLTPSQYKESLSSGVLQ